MHSELACVPHIRSPLSTRPAQIPRSPTPVRSVPIATPDHTVALHVWGDMACFTRPEMKAERVSYDVITPSAARGVLEAVCWKPQMRWVVTRIRVLKPIRFTNVRRNEVASKIPTKGKYGVAAAMKAGTGKLGLYVDEDRQQRAATLLRDVAYVIEADVEVLDPAERPEKYAAMFRRRALKGQCFTRPFLGCKEFAADFELFSGKPPGPPDELRGERDLGWMLHDIDFADGMTPHFFRPVMTDGVIDVPRPDWLAEPPPRADAADAAVTAEQGSTA